MKSTALLEETSQNITSTNLQPTIIVVEDVLNKRKIKQLFIKVDHQKLLIKSNNFLNCLDIFYKIHWIFNITYAKQATNLMFFFEMIFEMSTQTRNSVKEIYNQIFCKF